MSDSFDSLGLSAGIVRAVAEQGYTTPTPIQARAIPVILAGRDVLAAAQTGTGKTAGFTLPLLQRLAGASRASASPARHPVRALVVTPTRELAAQVEESVRTYGRHLGLRSAVVYGGVGMAPQVEALRRGVDILVATPGRLLDHAQGKTVDLSRVEYLVLDEADRMLDMGFIRDIRRILALLPARRQNLLFSATFSKEIRTLANGLLHDPVEVEVARRNAPSELVAQHVYLAERDTKRALLAHLVKAGDWRQVLVFTRTKHGANRLAEQLERDGIGAAAIHGNKSQPQRMKALAGFKAGEVRVLVATDIAARGLDIEELPHVVNYDMPHVAEDYVHRIGRTGRAGCHGEAVSLISAEEKPLLGAVEKLLGRTLERRPLPTLAAGTFERAPADAARPQERAPRPAPTAQPRRGRSEGDAKRRTARGPAPAPRRQPAGSDHPGARRAPVQGAANASARTATTQGDRSGDAGRGRRRNRGRQGPGAKGAHTPASPQRPVAVAYPPMPQAAVPHPESPPAPVASARNGPVAALFRLFGARAR